ncbi:MAG: sn-glycerol-3-phosphate ABC transporter ATP-binding protein UgpC [Candidatus Sericytochromatia bacterium]|nr:sn-glycerol-3-phosphate ABC transporter ATP-binding protein UgpC [Candidatus Sericytochromatia bacterium]
MAEIELRNVGKRFGDQRIVNDLSLQIADREFLVLVGASGCGKSTTLRMIAGLETPDEGEIRIAGRRVNETPPKGRDVAMVFQSYALYPHLSVFDNVAFSLQLRGIAKDTIQQKVLAAADSLGLRPLLDRKPKALSGGQRQRVALARAIVREPQAFLMDEPLSNLDAKLRTQTRVELKRLHQRLQTTTVYVTHDQTEAMTMGDRIAVMNGGQLAQIDTPAAIYEAPANVFVACFIGSPSMNLLRGTCERRADDAVLFQWGAQSLRLPISATEGEQRGLFGGPRLLGIRPEALTVMSETEAVASSLEVTVDVLEPAGSRTYLHGSSAGQPLVADLDSLGLPRLKSGDQLALTVRADQLHVFDADSERALLHTARVHSAVLV